MKIEKEVIVTAYDDNGTVVTEGDTILYTTKSSPYATLGIFKCLNEKGLVVLADFATKEEYAKAPATFATFQVAKL